MSRISSWVGRFAVLLLLKSSLLPVSSLKLFNSGAVSLFLQSVDVLEVGFSTPQGIFPTWGYVKRAEMLKTEKGDKQMNVDCVIVVFLSIGNIYVRK